MIVPMEMGLGSECWVQKVNPSYLAITTKMRFISLVPALLLFALPTPAWSQLPNAFDYCPLAIGNEWIYSVLQFDPYYNKIVASDTVVGDTLRVYKVLEEETPRYYYYNQDSTILYQATEFPRDINSGFPVLNTQNGLGEKWVTFNDGVTRAFALVDTGTAVFYGRTWQDVHLYEVDPVPDSLVLLEPLGRYAKGIGLIAALETGLIFARINGIEYGERPTSVEDRSEHNIPENFQLRLYPNPVNQSATFLFKSPTLKRTEVSIIDILGRTVRRFSINPSSQTFRLVWDGRDNHGNTLANGTYFAIARFGKLPKVLKFVYLKK